jgi:hypothetical protein
MGEEDTMNTIKCPKCDADIELTQALAAPALEEAQRALRSQLEAKDRAHVDAIRTATEAAATKARKEAKEAVERDVAAQVAEEQRIAVVAQQASEALRKQLEDEKTSRATAIAEATKKAKAEAEAYEKRVGDAALQATTEAKNARLEADALRTKLEAAQTAQAAAVRKERELDDAKRELDLTIETRVSAGLTQARTQAQRDAEALLGLKLAESQAVIESLRKEADEMRHKATQGDQRLQGEVQELQIEAMLREKFPGDTVEPVGKGVHGGDALLKVAGAPGTVAGSILFESKRTKTWDQKWLAKLREDMREAKADIAVLITATMPRGVETFELIEGVWVTGMTTAMPLTSAMRLVLQEAHSARVVGEGIATKSEMVYKYLTGPAFRARLQAAVEVFNALQDGLRKERAAMQRQWAFREGAHEKAIGALVGMHGDLGAIAGASLPELEGTEMAALAPVPA